ncbi:TadE family type IV pilus minor pilin [Saccharothrix variisporea]|uniref:TadE family type IV pilus minor pilin n=1 Tax=Saccharothrix variisporea TaxID=543527 RepID=UPI001FE4B128|nr:TadE family type IV pilus minor pilin [Saccharothrix variisporea]
MRGGDRGAVAGGRHVAGGDRGAATVEAALAVCGLVAALVLGVEAVMAVVAQIRCTDAAREAARLVARGEDGRVGAVVQAIAPSGAVLVVRKEGDAASVEVSAAGRLIDVRARAFAVVEPGAAGGAG